MDSTRARLHFLKRVFGSRSTAGRVATPQDLSVTKQHRNDRWDRCTASAGDWQIITTTSHRSANQRYFMHNSATVHRMRMQSSALNSSRSQLCNDTSTGVVRHQITKWRRLQKVVSYDVLHHSVIVIVQCIGCPRNRKLTYANTYRSYVIVICWSRNLSFVIQACS